MVKRYHLNWGDEVEPLQIEIEMCRKGGYVKIANNQYGNGLFHHYKEVQKLIWPDSDHHRWSDLMLKHIIEQRIIAISGARDSGKTFGMARFALTDYFIWPDETLGLISSTDLRGLQLRVWGNLKQLFNEAKSRFPWLKGNIVESLHGIFTDQLSDDTPVRDIRKGLICIPCLDRRGAWTGGLEKFVGIKQKRRRVYGDEVQFMHQEYLNILSNLDKGDFKGVFVGNAIANLKALDRISEPIEGWGNHPDPIKTEVFKNRFGGVTITLVGTDSPNYDGPADEPDRHPYLVGRADEKSVGERYGRNSEQYYSQIAGYRKSGLFAHRVLTKEMCEKYGAFKEAVWHGSPTTKIYGCDMGFGGDRAVAGWIEFGTEVGGATIVRVNQPSVIPISVDAEAEDQIALYIRKDCIENNIPGSQVFFEAGMRATAATAMAKLFSPDASAVNFGGSPSSRPVSADEWVIDEKTGGKRLKRCNEHYNKFVTELWFSVRLIVMAGQMRELPTDVADEFYLREWTKERGDKYELEKKETTKERTGFSPDLADWLAIAIEGARRLGFTVENMPEFQGQKKTEEDYLEKELRKYRSQLKKRSLNYT